VKIFTPLYDKTMQWSKHPHAPKYLAGMSFAEASFFPIPPDVLLMPMSLAKPEKALYYAWIATLFSTLGGYLGYAIGYWGFETIYPWLVSLGYEQKIAQIQQFFDQYGVWVVFLAGFTPIPYKLLTITAGAAQMALLPFGLAAFFGRGMRFFLVAFLMKVGGERYEQKIRASIDWMGWGVVALIILYFMMR